MEHRKFIHLLAGAALVLAMAVGTFYFSKKKPQAPGPARKPSRARPRLNQRRPHHYNLKMSRNYRLISSEH